MNDDLTLLPRLKPMTLQHMRANGVCTLDDVMRLSEKELRQFKGIGPVMAARLRHVARAYKENRPILYGALPEILHVPGAVFDIETNGYDLVPWSIGWQRAGEPPHTVVVNARLPEDEIALPDGTSVFVVKTSDRAWETFAEDAKQAEGLIAHWSGYDAGAMRDNAPLHVQDWVGDRLHNLLPTYEHTLALPARSSKLKEVARALGFTWREHTDREGAWWVAHQNYMEWVDWDDLDGLARACLYQRSDVEALMLVWESMKP
jgi:predicted RecB family nuclease